MPASTKTPSETTDSDSDWAKFKEVRPEDITVAIFCALSYESVAVKYSLDEEFECRTKTAGPRKYIYSFGRIGDHKLVIARPSQMGTVKAAQCAATVCQQFPNVRFALMIGIGAGIPSPPQRDIRLGDIVVSIPRDGHPGVVEYDFGKYELDGTFVLKGSLDKPPPILIGADGALEEDELMGRSPVWKILKAITKKPGYARCASDDVLFAEEFHHVSKGGDCSNCEASVEKKTVTRAERDKTGLPVVHRGLILSGGGVVKNPEDRNRLRRGYNEALCFEMEAAGIMDEIPCLVVRGICDYADTHKQDGWHHYAAAVAAAYGKAILLKVYGEDVQETESMRDTMAKLETTMTSIGSDIQDLKKITVDSKGAMDNREILDWLTPVDYGPELSDYLRKRQPGTGQWLLSSTEFEAWLQDRGQTLFCPGIPGGGKTFLTSIVIEHLTNRNRTDAGIGVAYFYCNFRRQYQQEVEHLLASLLKQLVQDLPEMPDDVKGLHDGHKRGRTRPSVKELSETLQSVASRYSKLFLIVDALDESHPNEDGRGSVVSAIFHLQAVCQANVFATSRFIPDITNRFAGAVSREIRASPGDIQRYIEGYVGRLPSFVRRDEQLQREIATGIAEAVDGMFLLAQIYLKSLDDKTTPKAVRRAVMQFRKQTPGSSEDQKRQILDEAYQNAMDRIYGQKAGFRQLAESVLAWITCAQRPLGTVELQHALAVEPGTHELDPQNLPQVEDMVSVCAGLVTVDEASSIIRLVHYTTQEYFERTKDSWFPAAERNVTEVCVTYLSFDSFATGTCRKYEDFRARLRSHPLYDYAAHHWGHHARKAGDLLPGVMAFLTRRAELEASSQVLFVNQDESSNGDHHQRFPKLLTALHFTSYYGILEMTRVLLRRARTPDPRDSYGRTPMLWAARNGHDAVVDMLIAAGANLDTKDKDGHAPLSHAAQNGETAVVALLLEKDAELDSGDRRGRTPLSHAAQKGHDSVVTLLLNKGAAADTKDRDGHAALSHAAKEGRDTVVQLLLSHEDVDLESRDRDGRTPLSWAAQEAHARIATLLLENLACIDSRDKDRRTPLSWAAGFGREATAELLVRHGADLDAKDKEGRTPLSWAAGNAQDAVVRLLLEWGAELESQDLSGRTPLLWAARNWDGDVAKTLLENGANLYWKDSRGWTPLDHALDYRRDRVVQELLRWGGAQKPPDATHEARELFLAAQHGITAVLERLIAGGADLERKDEWNKTPLLLAANSGHEGAVRFLLKHGADIESRAGFGTPLVEAAKYGHEAVVETLLEYGANVESPAPWGRTALSTAAGDGHVGVVKLLLKKGADVNATDELYGRTALSYAAEHGSEAIVRELLQAEASPDIPSKCNNWYPFDQAEDKEHHGIVRLLLEKGAEWESEDGEFRQRQLVLAIKRGYTAIVQSLLDGGADVASREGSLGWTPLIYAAQTQNERVVRLLLEGGADPNISDNSGRTPLSWAAAKANETIAQLLVENGAVVDTGENWMSWTPLCYAVLHKKEATVQLLLEKGADPEFQSGQAQKLLRWAAESGGKTALRLLLERGIDPRAQDEGGRTSLSHAAEHGHVEIVNVLHQRGVELDSPDLRGRTPLLWAAVKGRASVVRYLLTHGAMVEVKDTEYDRPLLSCLLETLEPYKHPYHPPMSRDEQEGYDTTIRLLLEKSAELPVRDVKYSQLQLSLAAKYEHSDIVELLLSKGVATESNVLEGLTPLFWAARNGDAATVSQLLSAGADTESQNPHGDTPLLWASINGHSEVVQLLLEYDADITGKQETPNSTPLYYADDRRHGGIVRQLIEHGGNSRPRSAAYEQFQLYMAAHYGYLDLVERLLQPPEVRVDGHSDELLLWAAQSGDSPLVRRLLLEDVDIECQDRRGMTPLSWAAKYGHARVVQQLVQKGARLECERRLARAPLSYAAGFGDLAVVKLLLDAGADRHSQDQEGRTPMAWATEGGHQPVVRLLELS